MSESRPNGKPFAVSKRLVWEAWLRVKANQGAAGVDEESIQAFEANLAGNLYKLDGPLEIVTVWVALPARLRPTTTTAKRPARAQAPRDASRRSPFRQPRVVGSKTCLEEVHELVLAAEGCRVGGADVLDDPVKRRCYVSGHLLVGWRPDPHDECLHATSFHQRFEFP